MILNRLYELATRPGEIILDDPAFERAHVPYVIVVGDGGECSIEDRRGTTTVPSRKKGQPPKEVPGRGLPLSIPRPHRTMSISGAALYFADTLNRVLLATHDLNDKNPESKRDEVAKRERSFATFWEQMRRAATETGDPALAATAAFGKRLVDDPDFAARVRADVARLRPRDGSRCTFEWYADCGTTILDPVKRKVVRDWFSALYAGASASKQEAGPVGVCHITGEVGPIRTTHPTLLRGIPGGRPTGVSLVSCDKSAYRHYGFESAACAAIGYRASDACHRALQALIDGTVGRGSEGGPGSASVRAGNTLFLFWTREPASADWVSGFLGDAADPLALKGAYESFGSGEKMHAEPEDNDFYVLAVSGRDRLVVHDYLERPVSQVKAAARKWFDDLRIADPSKDYQGGENDRFPLWLLAGVVGKEVQADTHSRLVRAAMLGEPLPEPVLTSLLGRLRTPSSDPQKDPFTAARLALVKLCLNRTHCKANPMTPSLDETNTDRAYACGRLLAFLARCQSPGDFGASAKLLAQFGGTASQTPSSVFPTLLRLNRHHIAKIRVTLKGFAMHLEAELESRLAGLRDSSGDGSGFPKFLTSAEQGRFQLGFYHQRTEYRRRSAAKKAAAPPL